MELLAQTTKVRNRALELGFDACGFAKAETLDKEARRLEEWLSENRQGTMHWMERNFDMRIDPGRLVHGTKSIISVIGSYHFQENLDFDRQDNVPKIAKYARGRDYHKVFKKKLHSLLNWMKDEFGDIHGRAFVDSAPVMDKAWAERAGLGWLGKNSNLLNTTYGSFFLIGEILTDLPFQYDTPVTDHCGSCTRCLDACPTNAIYEPYRIDSNRCISYLTIELKTDIPEEFHRQLEEWMFGCDICQDVCPWNYKAAFGQIQDFEPRKKMMKRSLTFWENLDEESYEYLFNGTPVRRAKYPRFKKNARIIVQNLNSKL
jgi:epoxyqueuosine reductase